MAWDTGWSNYAVVTHSRGRLRLRLKSTWSRLKDDSNDMTLSSLSFGLGVAWSWLYLGALEEVGRLRFRLNQGRNRHIDMVMSSGWHEHFMTLSALQGLVWVFLCFSS